MRLTIRHGIKNLRVEDIAAEADISVRNFYLYFSSKYEALAARYIERMRFASETLRIRPADEPLWDAVINSVLEPWSCGGRGYLPPSPETVAELRIAFGSPATQGEVAKAGLADENPFAGIVAARMGTDAETDLYPRLVAAAVTVTTQVAVNRFLLADPPVPLVPLLREALVQLSAYLPDPSTQSTGTTTHQGGCKSTSF